MKHIKIFIAGLLIVLLTACSRYHVEVLPTENSITSEPEIATMEPPEETADPSEENPVSPTPPTDTPEFKAKIGDDAINDGGASTITVHNADELINHMESNKHFLLLPGDYSLSKIDKGLNPQYFEYGLQNLENVIIEGVGDQQIDFFTRDYERSVLYIHDSKNITLKNLNLGHVPNVDTEHCAGAVLVLQHNDCIKIDHCTMFGCGTIGIEAYDVSELDCSNCVIKECNLDVMVLREVRDAVFDNCDFINDTDEAVRLLGVDGITIKNCRLLGPVSDYPPIIYNENSLFDKPSDGKEYIINQDYGDIQLINLSAAGQTLSEKLKKIHVGVNATVDHFKEELGGAKVISCLLTYDSPLNEAEYLSQIEAAKEVVTGNYRNYDVIGVYLKWPGITNSILSSAWNGAIWLWDNYENIENVMNDQREYLSLDEAKTVLVGWIPPLATVNGGLTEDEIFKMELNNTIIDHGNVYYQIEIGSNVESFNVGYFYVNAFNGSISVWFDGEEHTDVDLATQEQIDAVINYLKTTDEGINEDSVFRAYVVRTYTDFVIFQQPDHGGLPYILSDENGVLIAEPYEEWTGD